MVRKKVYTYPFLGMICGLILGIFYLFHFWSEVSGYVPQHTYRFGALGVIGFPIITAIIGILIGKLIEFLVYKLRN